MTDIRTKRLILRDWKESDIEIFKKIISDPRVIEFYPYLLLKTESDAFYARIKHPKEPFKVWAISIIDGAEFIGFIGLTETDFQAHFTPTIEIGWLLAYEYWGNGFATEAAKAVLNYAFSTLDLKEVVSITAVQNSGSISVMKKIGMTHDPKDDFDYPNLDPNHPLARHVLYRRIK